MVSRRAIPLGARLVLAIALSASSSWATPPAGSDAAEPATPDAEARAAFVEGLAALHAADWPLAEARFRHSVELVPRPSARYNLAFVLFQQGRAQESLSVLEQLLGDTAADPSYREHAETLAARIRSRLKADQEPPGAPRPAPVVHSPPAAPVTAPAPVKPAAPPKRTEPQSLFGPLITVGIGGALLVAGTVTGIAARRADNRFTDGCPSLKDCDSSLRDDQEDATRLGRITDVLLLSGAAFVVGGVTWRVVAAPPAEQRAARLRPSMVTMTVRY